jgi:ferrous iron transport protein A
VSASSLPLSDLEDGATARILSVSPNNPLRRRLIELGLVRGATVSVVRRAPLGDPVEIKVGGTLLALRASDIGDVMVAL